MKKSRVGHENKEEERKEGEKKRNWCHTKDSLSTQTV
jgi:hypothetical protein